MCDKLNKIKLIIKTLVFKLFVTQSSHAKLNLIYFSIIQEMLFMHEKLIKNTPTIDMEAHTINEGRFHPFSRHYYHISLALQQYILYMYNTQNTIYI